MRQAMERQSVVAGPGKRRQGARTAPGPLSTTARVRGEGEDFAICFAELKGLVSDACERQEEWEAKVIAGIQATVEFAAAGPAKAMALTVEARRPRPDGPMAAQRVTAYFARRLGELAPSAKRSPISTDESIVEAIALVVRGHLLAGTAEQLPDSAADFAYLTLMPYLGLAGTTPWIDAMARKELSA